MIDLYILIISLIVPAAREEPKPVISGTNQTGAVTGHVIFKGDSRKYDPAPINVGADLNCAKLPLFTEDVVLNEQTTPITVRNVLVSIKFEIGNRQFPIPRNRELLDQRACRFVPRVLAVRQEQVLTIRNSDPTNHNPHFLAKTNQEVNITQPVQGHQIDVKLKAEPPFMVKCDVHPWEKAWIAVFDHPYFAVTGEDGSFKLPDLPPGKYTMEAWHEKFGTLQASVELSPGENKVVDFTFAP